MDIRSGYTARMKRTSLVILLAVAASASVAFAVHARIEQAPGVTSAPSAASRLTIDQLIDIRHPSSPVWSPDGRRVAFLSERAGIANIFVANADPSTLREPQGRPEQSRGATSSGQGAGGARALTTYTDGQGGPFFWSRDSQRVYFARQGDLWQVAAAGGAPAAGWTTPTAETGITPAPDGTPVAFVRASSVESGLSRTATSGGTAPSPGAGLSRTAPGGRPGRGGPGGGGLARGPLAPPPPPGKGNPRPPPGPHT